MPMNNLNIRRPFYTMASIGEGEAEITMYGDIVESMPYDRRTGEPIEGSFVVQDEFLKDLEDVIASGTKKVKVRINSLGGDAGVSITVHNRLRELAKNGVDLSCIVDGVAMSGGSLIMCACDRVIVHPASLIMIHKAWSFIYGGYNADELREEARKNDGWDQAQISIYSRKCKLSETVISHMMSNTTYMTGREAIEQGFADELTEDDVSVVSASANRKMLFVHGRQVPLAYGMIAPDIIPTVTTAGAEVIDTKPDDTGNNEGGPLMAKNLEELRAENPELAAQIEGEVRAAVSAEQTAVDVHASAAERKRLSEIDEIAHLYDKETVREAKYGEHPFTAQELAYNAACKAAKNGASFMANAMADTKSSGANEVSAAPGEIEEGRPKTAEERMNEARNAVKSVLGKKEG